MRAILALMRASWLTASSYRIDMVISLAGVLAGIVPLYFVSHALQSTMAGVINGEGHQYFGFLLVGTVIFSFLPVAIQTLPNAVGGAVANGTLEAVLGTPTSVPALLTGLVGYSFAWTAVRAVLVLVGGALLGAALQWSHMPAALLILGLIVLAHAAIGVALAAAMLAYRTTGPLPQGILVVSGLLGGVYYPTHVIPSWIERISALLPLTYGLRALRKILLDGLPLWSVWRDVGILLAFTLVLLLVGWQLFATALAYARRTGSLATY